MARKGSPVLTMAVHHGSMRQGIDNGAHGVGFTKWGMGLKSLFYRRDDGSSSCVGSGQSRAIGDTPSGSNLVLIASLPRLTSRIAPDGLRAL